MLKPSDLQAIAQDLTRIYAEVESECIASIVRRITSGRVPTQASVWQMHKLSEVGALKRELTKAVAKQSRLALPKVESLIAESLHRSVGLDIDRIKADLLSKRGMTAKELYESITNGDTFNRILRSATIACKNYMNLTGTKAVQSSIASYSRAINKAYLKLASGNYDYGKCVRDAVREIGQSGIAIVEGAPSGKSLYKKDGELKTTYSSLRTYPLDSAIRRDLTTQINKSCGELTLSDADTLGTQLVETSWHMGSRPEHEKWQGKVFSLNPKDTRYPYFYAPQEQGGTGYGDILGLCGINCYHSFSPYLEGSELASQEQKPTAQENEKEYQEQQQQRSFERSIRALKRQQVAFREAGFIDEARKVQSRLNDTTKRYGAFLAYTGRTRVSMLDQITGYHRIRASQ